jgi:TIR domain-containing protein
MRVFISWSGDRAKHVAAALRDWLPLVVQSVEPWMSDKDLGAGQRWAEEIGSQLQQTDFGVIVVTPEGRDKPWPNFEAGALAKAVTTSRVVPYLVGMSVAELTFPLAMFNAVEADEKGTRKLVSAVNGAAKERALTESMLDKVFAPQWPNLKVQLDSVPKAKPDAPHTERSDRDILEEILAHARADRSERSSQDSAHGFVSVPLRRRDGRLVWIDGEKLQGINYMGGAGGIRHYMIRNDDGTEEVVTFDPVAALATKLGVADKPPAAEAALDPGAGKRPAADSGATGT